MAAAGAALSALVSSTSSAKEGNARFLWSERFGLIALTSSATLFGTVLYLRESYSTTCTARGLGPDDSSYGANPLPPFEDCTALGTRPFFAAAASTSCSDGGTLGAWSDRGFDLDAFPVWAQTGARLPGGVNATQAGAGGTNLTLAHTHLVPNAYPCIEAAMVDITAAATFLQLSLALLYFFIKHAMVSLLGIITVQLGTQFHEIEEQLADLASGESAVLEGSNWLLVQRHYSLLTGFGQRGDEPTSMTRTPPKFPSPGAVLNYMPVRRQVYDEFVRRNLAAVRLHKAIAALLAPVYAARKDWPMATSTSQYFLMLRRLLCACKPKRVYPGSACLWMSGARRGCGHLGIRGFLVMLTISYTVLACLSVYIPLALRCGRAAGTIPRSEDDSGSTDLALVNVGGSFDCLFTLPSGAHTCTLLATCIHPQDVANGVISVVLWGIAVSYAVVGFMLLRPVHVLVAKPRGKEPWLPLPPDHVDAKVGCWDRLLGLYGESQMLGAARHAMLLLGMDRPMRQLLLPLVSIELRECAAFWRLVHHWFEVDIVPMRSILSLMDLEPEVPPGSHRRPIFLHPMHLVPWVNELWAANGEGFGEDRRAVTHRVREQLLRGILYDNSIAMATAVRTGRHLDMALVLPALSLGDVAEPANVSQFKRGILLAQSLKRMARAAVLLHASSPCMQNWASVAPRQEWKDLIRRLSHFALNDDTEARLRQEFIADREYGAQRHVSRAELRSANQWGRSVFGLAPPRPVPSGNASADCAKASQFPLPPSAANSVSSLQAENVQVTFHDLHDVSEQCEVEAVRGEAAGLEGCPAVPELHRLDLLWGCMRGLMPATWDTLHALDDSDSWNKWGESGTHVAVSELLRTLAMDAVLTAVGEVRRDAWLSTTRAAGKWAFYPPHPPYAALTGQVTTLLRNGSGQAEDPCTSPEDLAGGESGQVSSAASGQEDEGSVPLSMVHVTLAGGGDEGEGEQFGLAGDATGSLFARVLATAIVAREQDELTEASLEELDPPDGMRWFGGASGSYEALRRIEHLRAFSLLTALGLSPHAVDTTHVPISAGRLLMALVKVWDPAQFKELVRQPRADHGEETPEDGSDVGGGSDGEDGDALQSPLVGQGAVWASPCALRLQGPAQALLARQLVCIVVAAALEALKSAGVDRGHMREQLLRGGQGAVQLAQVILAGVRGVAFAGQAGFAKEKYDDAELHGAAQDVDEGAGEASSGWFKSSGSPSEQERFEGRVIDWLVSVAEGELTMLGSSACPPSTVQLLNRISLALYSFKEKVESSARVRLSWTGEETPELKSAASTSLPLCAVTQATYCSLLGGDVEPTSPHGPEDVTGCMRTVEEALLRVASVIGSAEPEAHLRWLRRGMKKQTSAVGFKKLALDELISEVVGAEPPTPQAIERKQSELEGAAASQ